MADMKVEGETLRKFIKLAQTQALPFGFCPGPSDEDHVLMIDRKRKPALLGKAARTEGLGSKVACGTFEVTGRDMILTCERTTSALAKKMIRFLKIHGVKLNVVVHDLAGDDLTNGAGQHGAGQPQADQDAETDPTGAPGDAPDPVAVQSGDPDRATLIARLRQMQSRVQSLLDGATREKLTKAVRITAKLIAAGNIPKAGQTLDQIIRALERQQAALDPAARASPQKVRSAPG